MPYAAVKDDLKDAIPMKNSNLGMKFLEVSFVKSEIASNRLSFLPKMGGSK